MKKSSADEHLTSAGMAFDIILFLPIFLTNLVGILSDDFFDKSMVFFPVVLLIDTVLLVLFFSHFKNRVYRGEGIFYVILLSLKGLGLLGVIISYFS